MDVSTGCRFISTTDGLNIFDGLHTKIYRPSTHHMYGYNVQSNFFEDDNGRVWFTTYEALNYYDPKVDDLNYFFMVSASGDTIKENYKAFGLEGNNLYLKAGKEVFIYDIKTNRTIATYAIDASSFFQLTIYQALNSKILFTGSLGGYKVYQLLSNNQFNVVDEGTGDVLSVYTAPGGFTWIGFNSGTLSLYDPNQKEIVLSYPVTTKPILGITPLSTKSLFLSTGNEILEFDLETRSISQRLHPSSVTTGEHVNYLLSPYMDKDSTLWVGGDGQGVFFYNINKTKFKHFLAGDPWDATISVVKIFESTDGNFIILTRRNGIFKINKQGEILAHWNILPNGKQYFTAIAGTFVNPNQLLFCSYNQLYILELGTNQIQAITNSTNKEVSFNQIEKLDNGRIIASCDTLLLQEIVLKAGSFTLKPYGGMGGYARLTTYFKEDRSGNLFVSNDEVIVILLAPDQNANGHHFSDSLSISGGVWGLADDPKSHGVYITNTEGLFFVDADTRKFIHVKDRLSYLAQTIYAPMFDSYQNLWLSTNSGLLKYYPANGEVKRFSLLDGIQAKEYNSHAYLKTADGYMLFGGINGLNYFHPIEVHLSERLAPICISELKINDEIDQTYIAPNYLQKLILLFSKNTVSFEFHAIDYSDPSATRVKYKLMGVDADYIESKSAQGFARYANLRPGNYTFSIIGANSDGVWNQNPKELSLTIRPPFWLTWWFITLSAMAIGALSYWAIRAYYQRKLEKKNQLLREQSLIIEKQQAIEHERTRIASEMHDDLGSGLTTIRYLSDKALTQAKDAEEAIQIKKIADHSNALVRNMSEIIWAMNSRFDNAENLVGYLRRYASEYLDEHGISLNFNVQEDQLHEINVGGEKRRNIFLVFKEVLHNTVKYSGAKKVLIDVGTQPQISIRISEIGGKGFDPSISADKGNGLYNCNKRMATIHGQVTFEKTDDAMNILITAPLNTSSNE